MGVDVADVLGPQVRVGERLTHAGNCAAPFRMTIGDTKGVGRRAVAGQFGVNACAAAECVLHIFENHHAGAFTHDEAVATQVKRAGRLFRVLIPGRKRGKQVETGYA